MFVTLSHFANIVGAQELANIVSGRIGRDVEANVLLSGLANPEQNHESVLAQAVSRVQLAVSSAEKLANAYISVRYKSGLSESQIQDSPIPEIVIALAKHDLMLSADEDARFNYGKALEQLKMISNGKMDLMSGDVATPSKANIAIGSGNSRFDFGGFGR